MRRHRTDEPPARVRSVRLQPDLAGAVNMADTGVSRPGCILSLSVRSAIMTLVTRSRPPEGGHYDRRTVPRRAEMRRDCLRARHSQCGVTAPMSRRPEPGGQSGARAADR